MQNRAGHHDEAAWVQLFMIPTGVIGLLICGVGFVATSRGLLIAAGVVLIVHLAIGMGLHPR